MFPRREKTEDIFQTIQEVGLQKLKSAKGKTEYVTSDTTKPKNKSKKTHQFVYLKSKQGSMKLGRKFHWLTILTVS